MSSSGDDIEDYGQEEEVKKMVDPSGMNI